MGAPVRCRILGQLELRVGSGWVPPTGKLANALAILLVNAGVPVASGRLVRGIWPDPPATATGQLHKLMSELRELLTRAGRGDTLVSRRGVGYQLTVADGELDIDELDPDTAVSLFERVAREGGAVLDGDGDGPRAVAEACGGLPLALRVAGAHRAQYRHASSAELAALIVQGNLDIVRRQLDRLGIPQRVQEVKLADLPALAGGMVMNSWTPGVAVHRIGSVQLPQAPSFLDLLHRAYQAEPLTSP